jgi:hypothetical protein
LPDRIVLHHVAAELDDVKREAAVEGWTDGLTARALAALRIVAAHAINRASSQRPLAPDAPVPEGRLAAAHGWPRQVRVSVSSPVTTDDVGRAGSKLADSVSMTTRHHLEGLQQGVAVLTAAMYRQTPVRDSHELDEAVRHGASVARDLEQERAPWKTLWRTLWSRR